jgi:hypothetical protein
LRRAGEKVGGEDDGKERETKLEFSLLSLNLLVARFLTHVSIVIVPLALVNEKLMPINNMVRKRDVLSLLGRVQHGDPL